MMRLRIQGIRIVIFLLVSSMSINMEGILVKAKVKDNQLETIVSTDKSKNNSKVKRNFQLTDKQKLEDIEYLYNLLEKNQPHFDKELFNQQVKYIKENISNLNDLTFSFEIRRVLASAKDAHTKISDIIPNISSHVIPIWKIEEYNDGWYIKGITDRYKQYLGKEIIAVNGYPIGDIISKSAAYISTENQTHLKNSFLSLFQEADFLKYIGIIDNTKSIPITIGYPNGITKVIKINTIMSTDNDEYARGVWLVQPETGESEERYRFFSIDDSVLFIQCNSCMEDENNPLDKFESKLKKELSTRKYKKVIFDLRYNTGGNYPSFRKLTNIPSKLKNKYSYDLYALISSTTFSSGVMQAVQLKESGAILVGTPTGGNVNFYANTKNFQLPNSKISGYYSTAYTDVMPNYNADALLPDIFVKRTIQDALNSIDSDIRVVLNNK